MKNCKTKRFYYPILGIISVFTLLFSSGVYAQEDWEPQTFVTGYANTIFEWSSLDRRDDLGNIKDSWGVGLSEVAFLVSYKPIQKLEVKGTFVYTPYLEDLHGLIVEAYANYSLSDKLKFGAGRFLTPLSPVNQYFYAPVNISATLPMVVSHHEMLPQNITGFQISGAVGSDFKLNYNLTYGGYTARVHQEQGVLGIQGREELAATGTDIENPIPREYLPGGTARLAGNWKEVVTLGINLFDAREGRTYVATSQTTNAVVPTKSYTYGFDFHLNTGNFKFNTEYWQGKRETTTLMENFQFPQEFKDDFKAYYAEVFYSFNDVVTPYYRYDHVEDAKAGDFFSSNVTTHTIGINYRPIYEALFKVEYRHASVDIEPAAAFPFRQEKFDNVVISTVFSF